jgi:hypothetical protein
MEDNKNTLERKKRDNKLARDETMGERRSDVEIEKLKEGEDKETMGWSKEEGRERVRGEREQGEE